MKTIYKQSFGQATEVRVEMPAAAQILHFEGQGGEPTFWYVFDHEVEFVERRFVMYGTGHEIKEPVLAFHGTAQFAHGLFVLHLVEHPLPEQEER